MLEVQRGCGDQPVDWIVRDLFSAQLEKPRMRGEIIGCDEKAGGECRTHHARKGAATLL